MTTLDLRLDVSDEIVEYLKAEAKNRQVSLDVVSGDILTDYFAELAEDQILESIKVGMAQALTSEGRPASEVLAEVDRDVMGNAYDGLDCHQNSATALSA